MMKSITFLGTGLIRAYEFEKHVAKYPRIVIDDYLNPSPILVGWEKDDENIWYLDYMLLGYCLLCDSQTNDSLISRFEAFNLVGEQKVAIDNGYHNKFCKRIDMEELVIEEKKIRYQKNPTYFLIHQQILLLILTDAIQGIIIYIH